MNDTIHIDDLEFESGPVLPGPPTNVNATPSLICANETTILTASTPAGIEVDWYSEECGGGYVRTGPSILVGGTTVIEYTGFAEIILERPVVSVAAPAPLGLLALGIAGLALRPRRPD